MADNADVIKEFLVQLGFKIDKGSEQQFKASIGAVTLKAIELGAAVASASAVVVAGVAKISESLERLYFASQRTGATVANIQALQYAAANLGSSADAALGSLESLARLLRTSPGGEGLLKNIGIQTRDASGNLRDTVDMLGDLGKKFADMPFYKANAYAQALGIDEKTLIAMREGLGQFNEDYKSMLAAAGLDSQEAAKSSHEFMVQVRGLSSAFGILTQKIASSFTGKLAEGMQRFRENFVANFGRITEIVVKVLSVIFRLTDAIFTLFLRGAQALGYLIDWFDGLNEGSKKVILAIGAILVAWKLLSAGFLATPLGRITALITALALLWDDYQTWKEGGESLIDWSKWAPGIEAAIKGIKAIGSAIDDGLGFLGDYKAAFEIFLAYVAGTWALGMISSFGKVGVALAARVITPLLATAASAGGAIARVGAAALGSTAVLGTAAVAASGAAGYGVGTWAYSKFTDKDREDVGGAVNSILAKFGFAGAIENQRLRAAAGAPYKVNSKAAQNRTVAENSSATVTAPTNSKYEPRGIRNNNPGNLDFVGQTGATKEGGEGGRFAVFQSQQEGLNALASQLKRYSERGIDSIEAVISKYAPAKENNTKAYIASVAKKLGISADDSLDLKNNPERMQQIMNAIIQVENGKNPYSAEMTSKAVQSAGITAKTAAPTINQETKIYIASSDPAAAGRAVSGEQNNVNGQLVRNMKGAILQ